MSSWLKMLKIVGPIALAATPLAPIAPAVVAAIGQAEKIPGANGAQKKASVIEIVEDTVKAVNAQAGHTVLDQKEAMAAADNAIDTTIHAVNLAHQVSLDPTSPHPE